MDTLRNPERRRLLQAGVAVAAASLLPAVARANPGSASALPSPSEASVPEVVLPTPPNILLGHGVGTGPVALFAPLNLGAEIAHGWRLRDVRAPDRGAILVVLERAGVEARVHVCRHEGCGAGVAQSTHLDFLLMNGGRGGASSDEELGLAVMRLAALADANAEPLPWSALSTHEERIAAFGLQEPGVLR